MRTMNSWIANIVRRPVAVGVVYTLIFIGGVVSYLRLPLESGPAADLPVLEVSASWEHFSPETIEQMITAPLEEMVGRVEGVKQISSVSEEGRSTVSIVFDAATNIDLARLRLREQLAGFVETIPEELPTPTMQVSFPGEPRDLDRLVRYSLAGDVKAAELQQYAKDVIVPDLLSVEGIRRVEIFGGAEREMEIGLFADRMAALGVRWEEVARALDGAGSEARTSTAGQGRIRSSVSMSCDFTSSEDLRRVVVSVTPGGVPVRLTDIAEVGERVAPSEGVYRINGMPAVAIHLVPEPRIDIVRVGDALKRVIHDHRLRLPEGLNIVSESDPADAGRREQGRFSLVIVCSLLLFMIVVHLFLRNLQTTIVAVLSLVLCLALTFFAFLCLRISLHVSTLGALILGLARAADTITILLARLAFHGGPGGSEKVHRAISEIARPLSVSCCSI